MEHSTLEKATAYHEAGHAVAPRLVRMRFPLVTIAPETKSRRLCELMPGRDYPDDAGSDRRTIEPAKAHIFVHVAGTTAEMDSGARLSSDAFEERLWNAHRIAGWFIRNFVTEQAYVKFRWKRTQDYVDSHWEAVEVVARGLLDHERLTEREVRQLMRSTLRESDDFPRPNLL